MTYPPQQPLSQDPRYAYAPAYGQQPSAPQQPPYGAPQGTPWMPPQYGGQQLPTTPPKLGESGKGTGQGASAPAPRHLVGRTVIFEPIRIDETTKDDKGESRPTAHYHLTIVDGGPLQYGDNRDHDISKQHGMTMEVQTPVRFLNVQSDRYGIVNEIRDALARGDVASVGVVVQGTKGNRPFLVTKTGRDLGGNDRPDGAERFQRATQVWNEIFSKTFMNPEPRSLVAAPPSAPPQVQYQPAAPAGYAQQQYQQTGTVPTPYGATPAGQLHPEYVAAATQPAHEYQPPAPQPSALTQAVQQSAPPANPAFEAWLATLPPEQQAAQRAAMTAAPQPAGPGF